MLRYSWFLPRWIRRPRSLRGLLCRLLLVLLLNVRHFAVTDFRWRGAVIQRVRLLWREMLDVFGDRNNFVFTHHAAERRHDGLEPGNDFGVWFKDRFANVIIVGQHHAIVGKADRTTVDAFKIRTPRA